MRLARASTGLLLCSLAAGEPAAVELFHRMQHALGDPEKIAGIWDFEERLKAATWDRAGKPAGEVRKRVRWVKPGYLRLDQAGPYDTYSLFFDGTSGWESLPDGRQTDLEGGELNFARKYLSDFMLNIWMADRLPGYTVTSPARNVVRVSIGEAESEQIDIVLDTATWLPLRETSISLSDPAHPVPSETRIREWMTVRGVRFPGPRIANRIFDGPAEFKRPQPAESPPRCAPHPRPAWPTTIR